MGDHNKFGEAVGMRVSADHQCKLLMKDQAAQVDVERTGGWGRICNSMVCKSNRKYGTPEFNNAT